MARKVNPRQTALFADQPRARALSVDAVGDDVWQQPLGAMHGNRFRVVPCPRCGKPCVMFRAPRMPEERPIHDLRIELVGTESEVNPRWCEEKL